MQSFINILSKKDSWQGRKLQTPTKGLSPSASRENLILQRTESQDNILSINNEFKFYDLKADGAIDREELLKHFNSENVVNGIMARFDKNRDGLINYSEFYSEMSKLKDREVTLKKYLEKFPLPGSTPKNPDDPKVIAPGPSVTAPVPPVTVPAVTLISIQGRQIPLTFSPSVEEQLIEKILQFGPFIDWMTAINRIQNPDINKPELIVDKVHIQQVDMLGTNIRFVKYEVAAKKWNEKMSQVTFVPGIVFLRGGEVGILSILKEVETDDEYALVTQQPRIPIGYSNFPEIPAGMLCGEHPTRFANKAAKEMSEETLLEIQPNELYDLTALAYGSKFPGMYPSAGGCDEFAKLYLYRRYVSREFLDLLRGAHTGDGANEVITLKVVPLNDLWQEVPDSKALSALYLYTKFQELKVNHPPTEFNPSQTEKLKALLSRK